MDWFPEDTEVSLRLTAPSTAAWFIALIVGGLGILIRLGVVQVRLGVDTFWLVAGGFLLLVLATLIRRL
jgi:hypothetical protein